MSNRPREKCAFVCTCVCAVSEGCFPPFLTGQTTKQSSQSKKIRKYAPKTEKSGNPDAVYIIADPLFLEFHSFTPGSSPGEQAGVSAVWG